MNRKKRIYAKVIDFALLFFVFLILTKLSSGSSLLYYVFTYPFVSILIIYVYFGVLGNYFQGSVGKKLVGLVVIKQKSGFTPNMIEAFMREPVVQGIAIIFTLNILKIAFYNILFEFGIINITLLTPPLIAFTFIFITFAVCLVFIICFLFKREWWNKKYKIMTKQVYDASRE